MVERDRALQRGALEAVAKVDGGRGFRGQFGGRQIERCLGRRERSADTRLKSAHVLGKRDKQVVVACQAIVQAGLRQEVFLGRDGARGAPADQIGGDDVGLRRLHADVQLECVVEQADRVRDVELGGVGGEVLLETGPERIAQKVVVTVRPGHVIKRTGQAVQRTLGPEAGAQAVFVEVDYQVGHDAVAPDAVFGGADRYRLARRRRHVRRPPVALAAVVVVVDGGFQGGGVRQRQVHADAAKRVFAQAASEVVRVIHVGHAAAVDALGGIHRALVVRCVVIPLVAEAADHFERHVGIVDFVALRGIEESADAAGPEAVHDLGVELVLRLLAVTFAFFRALAGAAQVQLGAAANDAGVDPHEGARGVVAAERLGQRQAAFVARIERDELHRAAQVAGRCGGEHAGALRHRHAANVFRRDRTADVQAVIGAIAHVAERDVVEREAQLRLAEAADAETGRPFVGAERIGRLEAHARHFFECLQRAGTGQHFHQVVARDVLHLAGLALAEDRHHFDLAGRRWVIGNIFRLRMADSERLQDQQVNGF